MQADGDGLESVRQSGHDTSASLPISVLRVDLLSVMLMLRCEYTNEVR